MSTNRWYRPAAVGLTVVAAVAIALSFWISVDGAPRVAADAYTYLAAGERLNAGHHLYELRPGDRWIWINPPYWTVPLLSPPLIGVLWRPLAALPGDTGLLIWQALTISVICVTVAALIVRVPIRASLAAILLAVPLGFEMDVANVNGLLLGGYTLAWWLATRHRAVVGPLVAVMTAVKVAPILLAWWLVTQRRWNAVRWGLLTAVGVLALGVVGSSWEMHLRYLAVASETISGGNTDFSLAGLALRVGLDQGVSSLMPRVALGAGLGCVLLLRRRPGLAFNVAILTSVIASPVINFNTLALLLSMVAPLAWPWRTSTAAEAGSTTEWLPAGTGAATMSPSSSLRKDAPGP